MASLSERVAAAKTSEIGYDAKREAMFRELRGRLHFKVVEELGPTLYDRQMSDAELRLRVTEMLEWAFSQEDSVGLSRAEKTQLLNEITNDVLGYGPIDPLLNDPEVTEIMVNGPYQVFVERHGKLSLADVRFVDDVHLRRIIDKIVGDIGRRIDEATPMVDARLPDGSRVNAIVHPLSIGGPFLTIRKFAVDPYTEKDLVTFGTLSERVARFIESCVKGRLNIIISGGTGSGKTTTLNVLSGYLPMDERIVTIEDAAELQLHQEHVLSLESRPANIEGKGQVTIRDLVRNSLRMRPDRIVVGEARGGEALDMLQAMNTGHDGSLTTVHANSPRDCVARLETLCMMAGMDLPVDVIRAQIASAVHLIVQQSRMKDGSRKIIQVTEMQGMEGDRVTLQDIFVYRTPGQTGSGPSHSGGGTLEATGFRPNFLDQLVEMGYSLSNKVFGSAQNRFER